VPIRQDRRLESLVQVEDKALPVDDELMPAGLHRTQAQRDRKPRGEEGRVLRNPVEGCLHMAGINADWQDQIWLAADEVMPLCKVARNGQAIDEPRPWSWIRPQALNQCRTHRPNRSLERFRIG